MGRVMMHAKDHYNLLKGVTVFTVRGVIEDWITLHEAQ